jgi:hypothetical protein
MGLGLGHGPLLVLTGRTAMPEAQYSHKKHVVMGTAVILGG